VSPTVELHLGDCLSVLRTLPDASVDAVVTDPPAGIAFMGKGWDTFRVRSRFIDFLTPRLAECLRVARPGSYMLCWAIPRTSHWTATAIEDAGWIVRDRVSHIFGTGFPKGKACLKPAVEDWWLAWKPAKKVTPLGIDRCRIVAADGVPKFTHRGEPTVNAYGNGKNGSNRTGEIDDRTGRWPAHLVLSHSPGCNGVCEPGCPVRLLDEQGGERTSGGGKRRPNAWQSVNAYEFSRAPSGAHDYERDASSGGASRFFYCPKASRADRGADNRHPTVKSTDLMRWLLRLIATPGDVVLDPFMGSGSTGKAAALEGMGFVGIEGEPEYYKVAEVRIAAERDKLALLEPAS
jgi:hypothetical protein